MKHDAMPKYRLIVIRSKVLSTLRGMVEADSIIRQRRTPETMNKTIGLSLPRKFMNPSKRVSRD